MSKWFITTDKLPEGRKVMGPFESRELALDVRTLLEDARRGETYWVDEEVTAALSPQPQLKQAEGTPAKGEGENTSA